MIKQKVELQVSINIGKKKYLLEIQKDQNLSECIQYFLWEHNLNKKYHTWILNLIRQQLRKKSISSSQELRQFEEVKQQIQNKRKKNLNQGTKQNKAQNVDHTHNDFLEKEKVITKKNMIINKLESQFQEKNLDKGRNVYEKWKVKQRQKSTKMTPKTPKTSYKNQEEKKMTIKLQNRGQNHHSDYFYRKGLKFQEVKQKNKTKLFHQQYPFTSRSKDETSITPEKKAQLHSRLYKQSKIKMRERIRTEVQQKGKKEKSKKKVDEIKLTVMKRDKEIDKTLSQLLEKGVIKNPHSIQVVAKSPFRRTIYY